MDRIRESAGLSLVFMSIRKCASKITAVDMLVVLFSGDFESGLPFQRRDRRHRADGILRANQRRLIIHAIVF
jgi:hypothetical protein